MRRRNYYDLGCTAAAAFLAPPSIGTRGTRHSHLALQDAAGVSPICCSEGYPPLPSHLALQDAAGIEHQLLLCGLAQLVVAKQTARTALASVGEPVADVGQLPPLVVEPEVWGKGSRVWNRRGVEQARCMRGLSPKQKSYFFAVSKRGLQHLSPPPPFCSLGIPACNGLGQSLHPALLGEPLVEDLVV